MKNEELKYFLKSYKFLKPYKSLTFFIAIGLLLATGISIAIPFFTEDLISAFAIGDAKKMLNSSILLVIIEVAHSLTHILFWGTSSSKLQTKITKNMRYNLIESITRLKNKNFDLHGSGMLLQIVTNDTASLALIYNKLMDVIISITSKLAIYVYIFITSPLLGVYCAAEIFIVYLANRYRMNKRITHTKKYNIINDQSTGLVNEIILGARDIKNYNIEKNILEKVDLELDKLQKVSEKNERVQYILWRFNVIIQNIMFFGFIPFTLLLIKYNLTTFEIGFVVFIFKKNITQILDWIVECIEKFKDGGIYAKRIFHLLDGYYDGFEEFPFSEEKINPILDTNIIIKNLNFAYNGDNLVLENFNLDIKQNTKIAIVGGSGSGKSSLLKLLNKSYDIEKGKIFIGGIDICDYSKSELRSIISIVPQNPYIFNFSIRENLSIVKKDATDEEIIQACKKAQIHDYICTLKDGYNTVLGEGGVTLSGGQKQRLSIARAFLKDSPVLIFDEATSALDNQNQEKIKKVIDNIGADKTVIIVAHRLSTVVDADEIYFIKDKRVFAKGNHLELMTSCEEYKRLYIKESY